MDRQTDGDHFSNTPMIFLSSIIIIKLSSLLLHLLETAAIFMLNADCCC
jgi:hypothetical protein